MSIQNKHVEIYVREYTVNYVCVSTCIYYKGSNSFNLCIIHWACLYLQKESCFHWNLIENLVSP